MFEQCFLKAKKENEAVERETRINISVVFDWDIRWNEIVI